MGALKLEEIEIEESVFDTQDCAVNEDQYEDELEKVLFKEELHTKDFYSFGKKYTSSEIYKLEFQFDPCWQDILYRVIGAYASQRGVHNKFLGQFDLSPIGSSYITPEYLEEANSFAMTKTLEKFDVSRKLARIRIINEDRDKGVLQMPSVQKEIDTLMDELMSQSKKLEEFFDMDAVMSYYFSVYRMTIKNYYRSEVGPAIQYHAEHIFSLIDEQKQDQYADDPESRMKARDTLGILESKIDKSRHKDSLLLILNYYIVQKMPMEAVAKITGFHKTKVQRLIAHLETFLKDINPNYVPRKTQIKEDRQKEAEIKAMRQEERKAKAQARAKAKEAQLKLVA